MREQFTRLQNLCDLLEKTLGEEAKRRDADGKRQLEGVEDEEEQGWLSVGIENSLFEVNRDFPRIVRYSLLVSMMSTTEACLVRLCRHACCDLGISEFNEKGINVIQRALTYLHDDAGLDISGESSYKMLADNLSKLRNAITHSEGRIKARKDENVIRIFAQNHPSAIEIDIRDNIILLEGFVSHTAHDMSMLIDRLRRKLQKKVDTQTGQNN